jgi:NDP-sugar pyrophosphorylase family protein
MKAALVIMAAGMGSRYGGSKQVDGLGPNGEILMEYSIYDAIRAGFSKVVFIIKPDMKELVEELCGRRVAGMKANDGSNVEVAYAFQDFSGIPSWYAIPPERTKPFGTAQAVLCARDVVHEPFAVINADDYYGADAFSTIYAELGRLPERGKATMVGYRVDKTVSENGTVTRGVCQTENGRLTKIVETFKIKLYPNGDIRDIENGEDSPLIPPATPVSMNFWGFTPWIFDKLEAFFAEFLKNLAPDNIKGEALLPTMVGELIERGELRVTVLHSNARWFGVTYQEDKGAVQAELKKLHDNGAYPASLRE